MLARLNPELRQEDGFTLIELLVVILIIGILAAIAIPSFLNQRYKGQDACAKSMVKQMQTAIETYNTDNNTYAGITVATLNGIESSIVTTSADGCTAYAVFGAPGGTASCGGSPSQDAYCAVAHSATGNYFLITNVAGQVVRRCLIAGTNPNRGGCKAASDNAGTWGTW